MAIPTDPNFGGGFDADAFRSAIISTMEMGMANGSGDVATFYWLQENEYEFGTEKNTVPYDLSASAELVLQAAKTVVVPVAIEFISRATSSAGIPAGDVQAPRVIVTILDTWISSVSGADGLRFSGNNYSIDYIAPVTGLFDVNVYDIYASALDES